MTCLAAAVFQKAERTQTETIEGCRLSAETALGRHTDQGMADSFLFLKLLMFAIPIPCSFSVTMIELAFYPAAVFQWVIG
jgi:hypothetical protein